MTNDDLIRQVATEIRQHHHRGTMEEALDAAKAVIAITEREWNNRNKDRDIIFRQMNSQLGLISAITDPQTGWDIQAMVNSLAFIKNIEQSYLDGEDYQLLSTAPQIVEEIIDPEERNAPASETQEGTGTPAGQ